MHTYFNDQLYTLTNGRRPADQRAYDARTGEFAHALTEFWNERARSRRARRRRFRGMFSLRHSRVRAWTLRQPLAR